MVRRVHAAHFVQVNASGAATAEEQFAAVEDAARGSVFDDGNRMLFDARDLNAEAEAPGTADLQLYAQRIGALGYRRYALVVGPDRVEISSAFALYCAQQGVDARVFSDIDRATRWLKSDIPASPAA